MMGDDTDNDSGGDALRVAAGTATQAAGIATWAAGHVVCCQYACCALRTNAASGRLGTSKTQ